MFLSTLFCGSKMRNRAFVTTSGELGFRNRKSTRDDLLLTDVGVCFPLFVRSSTLVNEDLPAVNQRYHNWLLYFDQLKPCWILLEFTLRKGELNGRFKEKVSTWVKRNALLDNCRTFPCIIFNTVKKLSFQAGHIYFAVKIRDRFVCLTVYWPIENLVVDIS